MDKRNYFKNIKKHLHHARRRAKEKGIEYDIDMPWFRAKLNKGRCEVTGLIFNDTKDPYVNPFYPSIDRIDSSKGYTKDNCQVVCMMFNNAKQDHDIKHFETWCKAFVEKYENLLG
jgi:hypothetical protein